MIPVGDSPRTRRTPLVNYAIILANVAVFIWMLTLDTTFLGTPRQQAQAVAAQADSVCYTFQTAPTEIDHFYCRWSLQPREFFDAVRGDAAPVPNPQPRWEILLTIITSMFLHGGWLHIAGNMLFLWVFGDNIEDRLGHLGYLLFYLAAGIAASLVQGWLDATSLVPVLGASGAVAGVLGAYIVWFPKATVSVVIPFFVLIFIPHPRARGGRDRALVPPEPVRGVRHPRRCRRPDQGVAWFAHIGGFLFGMLSVLLFLRRAGHRPPRWRD
ncbi:MAG: rhomboid family intramembrane serine protease [Thermoflexaceae bacterium]|nr:rhomboid family intramembrane serine protease [Thermoflexaceae bacterium]